MAENYREKDIIDGEEIEVPMVGEISPDQMEQIMNTLIPDFFDKYPEGRSLR